MNILVPWIVLAIVGFWESDVAGGTSTSLIEDLRVLSRLLSEPKELYDTNVVAGVSDTISKENDTCGDHLQTYKDNLTENEWAMRMFDSSTKLPEGVLMGNVVQLGVYDECVAVRDIATPSGVFHGQHCLASLTLNGRISGETAQESLEQVHTLGLGRMGIDVGQVVDKLTTLSLQVALCIPSSCSAEYLQQVLTNVTAKYNMNVSVAVDPIQCSTDEPPTLRAIDFVAIVVVVIFVAMAVLSTVYDIRTCDSASRRPLFLSFSVYANWNRLMSVSKTSDTLTALHGMRFISIGWVVLGHRYLTNAGLPNVNRVYMLNFAKDWSRLTVMNGTLSVDTFLLMSGLLLSYVFLKEVNRRNRFNVPMFYIHRYIRLTPALAIMILLQTSILNYAGSGPLWATRIRDVREKCENNWWTNLLYINNYVNIEKMCLGQTWYLSVDMQLYWLSPLILVPLWKCPRIAQPLMLLLILGGWGVAFAVPFVEHFHAGTYTGTASQQTLGQKYEYYPTHTRFMPWLIGVALGFYVRQAKERKLKLPNGIITAGWLLSTVLTVGALHLAYPFQQPEYVYGRVESAFYISLFRPAWALGVAWIIFACELGEGGAVNMVLSWRVFQPLGRLAYGIYLTHVSVLLVITSSIKTPQYLADSITIPQFMGDLFISLGCAIALCLLFESPIMMIEKSLLGTSGGSENPKKTIQPQITNKLEDLEKGSELSEKAAGSSKNA